MQNIIKYLKTIIKVVITVIMGSLIGIFIGLVLFIVMQITILPFAVLVKVLLFNKVNFGFSNLYKVIVVTSMLLGQIIGLFTCIYLEFKVNK